MARDPVFLERKTYRQRRMMDAVRLLPILGLALWMVPLMWAVPEETTQSTPISTALRYVFGIWALMIMAAWALWRRTRSVGRPDEDAR